MASATSAGKVVAITGASSGLGRGIAVGAARRGMKVVVGDIEETSRPGNFDETPELTTTALIESEGGEALYVPCDVTKPGDTKALIARTVERFGRLDVLVSNAGIWRGGPFHDIPEESLDLCLNVIVKGGWFASQAAIRQFLAQGGGGSIIHVVSTAGLRGHPWQSAYNVAKGGQANLVRCLALEYGAQGIRVNGICPTNVKTGMSRGGFEHEQTRDGATRRVPLGRWGEIADVTSLALFLASDEAAFISGALIPVDGGETLGAARSA